VQRASETMRVEAANLAIDISSEFFRISSRDTALSHASLILRILYQAYIKYSHEMAII
jgi:hypothetical protein